jgi:2'-5' RNA ligase
MKKRLFVALNFDPATRLAVARLVVQLPNHSGLNKTKVDNLHLTLLFLGDTDEELIPQLSQALEEIAATNSALTLQFNHLGGFPDLFRPQTIWIGLTGDSLNQLQQAIAYQLLSIVPTADTKPFRPHLTIARVKGDLPGDIKSARLGELARSPLDLPPIRIAQIDLMESTLRHLGPSAVSS